MTSSDNLRAVRSQLAEARKKHMTAALGRTDTTIGGDKLRQVQMIMPDFDKAMELSPRVDKTEER